MLVSIGCFPNFLFVDWLFNQIIFLQFFGVPGRYDLFLVGTDPRLLEKICVDDFSLGGSEISD